MSMFSFLFSSSSSDDYDFTDNIVSRRHRGDLSNNNSTTDSRNNSPSLQARVFSSIKDYLPSMTLSSSPSNAAANPNEEEFEFVEKNE
jgi:hypothetical protein